MSINSVDTIIIRSNSSSSDLLSAFGSRTKETRLTAILGYLFFLKHTELLELFQIRDEIKSVQLEYVINKQRADILVIAGNTITIIEAKLYFDDPYLQILKQAKEIRLRKEFKGYKIKLFALTQYKFNKQQGKVKYIFWNEIHKALLNTKQLQSNVKILGEEMAKHMENQGLVKSEDRYEVYAREVNAEINLKFFLQGCIYFCKTENNNKIERCSYFAPHFGAKISSIIPGIQQGISYIAKIKEVEYVKAKDVAKFNAIVKKHNIRFFRYMQQNNYTSSNSINFNLDHKILLLERPAMVFNPPIQKGRLQKGSGWLSKKYFAFSDLFDAWLTGKPKV
jgi:hypothetical protein